MILVKYDFSQPDTLPFPELSRQIVTCEEDDDEDEDE